MQFKQFFRNSTSTIFSFGVVRAVSSIITGHQAVIFMLHRFSGYSQTAEVEHEQYYLREVLDEVRKLKIPVVPIDYIFEARNGDRILDKNVIAFTMDDGFLDQAEIGAEIFIEYDCPATIFVVSEFLDDTYWLLSSKIEYLLNKMANNEFVIAGHDGEVLSINNMSADSLFQSKKKLIEVIRNLDVIKAIEFIEKIATKCEVDLPLIAPYDYRPMTWADARKLEKRGITIGAHTCKHPVLSMESNESSSYEIQNSFKRVCEELDNPSRVFCYPTGRYSDFSSREMKCVKESGYIGAVNAENGYAYASESKYNNNLSVNRFTFPDNLNEFKQYVLRIECYKDFIRNLV